MTNWGFPGFPLIAVFSTHFSVVRRVFGWNKKPVRGSRGIIEKIYDGFYKVTTLSGTPAIVAHLKRLFATQLNLVNKVLLVRPQENALSFRQPAQT